MLRPSTSQSGYLWTNSPPIDHFVAKTELSTTSSTASAKLGGKHVGQARSATISSPIVKKARLSPPEDHENGVSGAVMVDSVKTAIWNALNHYAFEDAVFAAERLYAEVTTAETAYLLATCLYRAGQKHHALEILSRCPPDQQATSDIRYLIGKINYDLEQYAKAEIALADCPAFGKAYRPEDVENLYAPDACSYALQLLGNIHQKSQRKDMAVASLKRAVSLNPFQWSSFEAVCSMKEDISAKGVFFRSVSKSSQVTVAQDCEDDSESFLLTPKDEDIEMVSADEDATRHTSPVPYMTPLNVKPSLSARKVVSRGDKSGTVSAKRPMRSIGEESSASPSSHSSGVHSQSTLRAPGSVSSLTYHPNLIKERTSTRNSSAALPGEKTPFRNTAANSSTILVTPQSRARLPASDISTSSSGPVPRRSVRLQANKTTSSAVKENKNKSTPKNCSVYGSTGKIARKDGLENSHQNIQSENIFDFEKTDILLSQLEKTPKKPDRKRSHPKETTVVLPAPPTAAEPLTETTCTEQERLTGLVMRSYCRFGEVVQLLYRYDIPAALDKLSNISPAQREAPFYFYLKGRLHCEIFQFQHAVHAFEEMRLRDPCYIRGVDYYSVALWQLQKEKELAILAKYLTENHRDLPETYVVYGNVFSVQGEHEYAIKMFRRALQLNPNYAYALTLVGHEYATMDERDKAAQCFRLAIHADPSHYNGWYGLGTIECKKENYAGALANFKKALEVYPTNPVILVQLGVAQHSLKQSAEAMKTLSLAVASYPNNPLCRFQKASLLYSLGHLDKAQEELEILKDLAPKESLVYFLMGKVCKRTDKTHQALMYFSKAMDLDPKGTNNQIKEAFNKLYGGMEDDVVPQRAASGTTCSRDSQASSTL